MSEMATAYLAGMSYALIVLWALVAGYAVYIWWLTRRAVSCPWWGAFFATAVLGVYRVHLEVAWIVADGWAAIGAMPNLKWTVGEGGAGVAILLFLTLVALVAPRPGARDRVA